VSTSTINDVFSTGLAVHDDYGLPSSTDLAPFQDMTPSDHFSTATWCLPNGRTARSVATAQHCESESNISRIRRVILNLSGRKLEEQS
jgi:hypothetical protein